MSIGMVIPQAEYDRLKRIEEAAKRVAYELDIGLIKVRERVLNDLRNELEKT